jgi:hypothetical protein
MISVNEVAIFRQRAEMAPFCNSPCKFAPVLRSEARLFSTAWKLVERNLKLEGNIKVDLRELWRSSAQRISKKKKIVINYEDYHL